MGVQQRDSYCQKCVRSDNIKIMPEAAKKSPAKKAAKPKAAPAHPPTATMVMAAVKGLKEAKGASLPAIKKYIAGNYKVDIVKLSPFVRKALKSLVEKKKLVQTKGTGASGRFKANKEEKPKKVAKPKAKKVTKKAAKKPAGEKKAKTPKKKAAAKPKKACRQKARKEGCHTKKEGCTQKEVNAKDLAYDVSIISQSTKAIMY